MADKTNLYRYALRMGDTAMVLSQRLCEQVGTAPMLEEEIAIANIGLDMIGQATAWYELAATYQGDGKTADDLAYLRNERDYSNFLIAELENGDFAQIILRGYLISDYLLRLYNGLQGSSEADFVAIAQKSVKEVTYHHQHQADWVERLGLGTAESHRRLSNALEYIWPYTQELFEQDDVVRDLTAKGVIPDFGTLQQQWLQSVSGTLKHASLTIPEPKYYQRGGLHGTHTETLGYLLAEMQAVVREHPGAQW